MRVLLALTAAAEAATGLIVLVDPSLVVTLLFGAELAGAGVLVGRFAGIALLGLGVACWPGGSAKQPLVGMLVYGVLATLYFLYLGVAGGGGGVLLWPAVAIHLLIDGVLVSALRRRGGS